jgi:hypothetical protein
MARLTDYRSGTIDGSELYVRATTIGRLAVHPTPAPEW